MLINKLPEIYRIRLTMPFKLNHINCYAIKGINGWGIIDTGLNTSYNKVTWQMFMKEHRIIKGEVRGIFITHHHRDHFGLAGWLQQITGAPVYVSPEEVDSINCTIQNSGQYVKAVAETYKKHGAPPDLVALLSAEISQMIEYNDCLPKVSFVENGDIVRLGQDNFKVLLTPGHSDGHISFYNEQQGILFTGDHLLPEIVTSICLWPGAHPDPLNDYLNSLQVIKDLYCPILLPAHGNLFTNMTERIEQLKNHHTKMLNAIIKFAGEGISVYEMCNRIFGQRVSLSRIRFALLEILACSMFLVYRGKLGVNEVDGISTFFQT